MYTYTIVGGWGGALPTSPHPLNTCSHNTATRRPPHPSNTQQHTTTDNNRQQHTTTVHNSTRVHKTTNVLVVFMALILNGFEACNIITRGIGRGGPWKSRLFWAQMALASLVPFQGPKKSWCSGPTPSNAPRNDVALLKTITYRAIKTTGTLIVIVAFSNAGSVNYNILNTYSTA